MNKDFISGVILVVNGLADAAKKASYSLGFGSGALGGALWFLGLSGVSGAPLLLMSISAFFIAAKIGVLIDDRLDLTRLKAKEKNNLELQQIRKSISPVGYTQNSFYHLLVLIVEENSLSKRRNIFQRIIAEFGDLFISQ